MRVNPRCFLNTAKSLPQFSPPDQPDTLDRSLKRDAKGARVYQVAALYALAELEPTRRQQLQDEIKGWKTSDPSLCGLVILAPDGLNATIASRHNLEAPVQRLAEQLPLSTVKWSQSNQAPFQRWKVVQRRETITTGLQTAAARMPGTTTHLSPDQWHQMMQRRDVTILDTRNQYEIRLGQFHQAIDPETENFSQFFTSHVVNTLPRDRPLLTYCTGGIRCEKAVPWLLEQGFTEVYQLEGGILNYLEHYPDGHFEGDCFVFDERIAVNGRMEPAPNYSRCTRCGQPRRNDDPCLH